MLAVDRRDVWRVIADPYHLARWWPRVMRVESVYERKRGSGTQWTKVLATSTGKGVRADFRCRYAHEPESYCWEQEIPGSPFAKVLRSAVTTIRLEEAEGGTLVRLEVEQRLRGMSRLGGFMLKRATAKQLNEALDGLERAVVDVDREEQAHADEPA